MRSLRSPVPICDLRWAAYLACSSAVFCSSKRDRSTFMACSLFFCCERPSMQRTIMPLGLCWICTAESVVFTPWPPGPEARQTLITKSSGLISISTASASGNTATVTVLVCTRPCVSVAGTRCTRWTPLSNLSFRNTSWPLIPKMTSLNPPRSDVLASIGSTFQPCDSAYRMYMRCRSAENRADSAPPAPARISTIVSRESVGFGGMIPYCNSSPSLACSTSSSDNSSRASSASSEAAGSLLSSSLLASMSASSVRKRSPRSASFFIREYSRVNSRNFLLLLATSGLLRALSNSSRRLQNCSMWG